MIWDMEKKQRATQQVRVYPGTYRQLKVLAARQGITLAAYIAQLV